MGTARPPVPIEAYMMLAGYQGAGEEIVAYVPATTWHMSNTYFDGIKYTGPLAQNPLNPLTVEDWVKDFEETMERRKKLQEEERARYTAEME